MGHAASGAPRARARTAARIAVAPARWRAGRVLGPSGSGCLLGPSGCLKLLLLAAMRLAAPMRLAATAAALQLACAAIDEHEVLSLPGWEGPLPSRHWAGQIKITPDGHPQPKWMFYWFAEAEQRDPATAPTAVRPSLCRGPPPVSVYLRAAPRAARTCAAAVVRAMRALARAAVPPRCTRTRTLPSPLL